MLAELLLSLGVTVGPAHVPWPKLGMEGWGVTEGKSENLNKWEYRIHGPMKEGINEKTKFRKLQDESTPW